MRNPSEDKSQRIAAVTDAVRFQLRAFGGLLIAVNLLLPLGLYVYARVVGQEYWRLFDGEVTAVNWVSSVQLVLLAVLAGLNRQAVILLQRVDPERRFRYPWIWFVFAVAFLLLAIDERFAWHEALREAWPPAGAALLGVWIAGATASYFLLGHLRRRPGALAFYAAAIILALAVAIIGAFPESTRYNWPLWYFWDYSFEETAELWAQALFGLAFLRLLHARVGAIGRAAIERATPGLFIADAQSQLRLFARLMAACNVLLPAGFAVWAAFTDDRFFELFWGERDAISWFSSLQLLGVGFTAWFVAHAEWLRRRPPFGLADARPWVWLPFAAGFAFLAIDERFEFHEAIRDEVMQPAGHFDSLPGIVAGDVGLYLYLAVGLVFTAFLLRELRRVRPALILFCSAVALSAIIVVEDSLTESARAHLPAPEFWNTAFEEIGEIWAQFCFLLGFLVYLAARLADLTGSERTG